MIEIQAVDTISFLTRADSTTPHNAYSVLGAVPCLHRVSHTYPVANKEAVIDHCFPSFDKVYSIMVDIGIILDGFYTNRLFE